MNTDQILSKVETEVFHERARQRRKGYDADHDDTHGNGDIVLAALWIVVVGVIDWPGSWPLARPPWALHILEKWRHDGKVRLLVIAAALLIAEAERLERASSSSGRSPKPS